MKEISCEIIKNIDEKERFALFYIREEIEKDFFKVWRRVTEERYINGRMQFFSEAELLDELAEIIKHLSVEGEVYIEGLSL